VKHITITIDGPAGTGKSTIAQEVAKKLGYLYLDTGALYRAAALAIDAAGADVHDDAQCGKIASQAKISFTGTAIELNGTDVTSQIRTNRMSSLASKIAVHPSVRKALLAIQRSFKENNSLVAEGRDTGSVVFPDAQIKIFLDASVNERAKRRHEELLAKGAPATYDQVLNDVKARDNRDTTRDTSPLVVPEHAIVVDTTHLDIAGVLQKVLEVIQEKLADK
jgi:cytidylate kinase